MKSAFTHPELLDYLAGEDDVVRAAAAVCDVLTQPRAGRSAFAQARDLLTYTLVEAGLKNHNLLEISVEFMFVYHGLCEKEGTSHFSPQVLERIWNVR